MTRTSNLTQQAEAAQRTLQSFWDENTGLYRHHSNPQETTDLYHYWWFAHTIDALIDGFERSQNPIYLQQAEKLHAGMLRRTGAITNDYYDDMEWLALALLRLYKYTQKAEHLQAVDALWHDIQHGWNDHCGGGIAWKKTQLDYKNAPANFPAAILAARLYRLKGNPADLEFSRKIYHWTIQNLMDPQTGCIWDGLNRQQDGSIDRGWLFTYNQGTGIGAALELHQITGDSAYLQDAKRIAEASLDLQTSAGFYPDEGNQDGGLFKGILIRYLTLLALHCPDAPYRDWISAQTRHFSGSGPYGPDWEHPDQPDTLSTHLSGLMLLEAAHKLR
ncbi:glycoside hydrolase family 76 protein [Deinococcus roseus]|uniref:Glycoside hydrolase n=1 Tax=Deinococcus roseus TaxID=392414 RepID=A0ABQ2D2M3_9DEIO|nr:glycoside hydrolase family 76 protein [Deinococcus roseus]GGJ43331.1 glycoside hydrolase [Deinococcus roseus]